MDERQLHDLVGVIVDHLADLVVLVDQTGHIRWANARASDVLEASLADWVDRPVVEMIHPDDIPLALELLVSARASGSGVKEPVTFRLRGGGDWVSLEVVASNVELPGGELATVYSARPTAPRRDGVAIVGEASERLSRMFEDAAIGMAQISLRGRLLRVNSAFAGLLGAARDDLIGAALLELLHADDAARIGEMFELVVAGAPRVGRASARLVGAGGQVVHTELTVSLVDDRLGAPMYCAMQVVDVTALKEAEAELLYRSTHDPLTGLVNRTQLFHLLDQALARATRRNEQVTVLYVDLDGFKAVNDTFGHAAGDELLCGVGERLVRTVRRGDVVARIGGDEFVVMCEEFSRPDEAAELAERLIDELSKPFHIDAGEVLVGASVGLASEPATVVGADELVRHADAALYQAKRGGRGRVGRHQRAQPDAPRGPRR